MDVLIGNKIDHPNIVKLIEILKTEKNFYCVYELIDGDELRTGKGLKLK